MAVSIADALMIRDTGARLAAILLILSSRIAPSDTSGPINIETNQDDLARMANLSRSSTGRLLQTFEAEGSSKMPIVWSVSSISKP